MSQVDYRRVLKSGGTSIVQEGIESCRDKYISRGAGSCRVKYIYT